MVVRRRWLLKMLFRAGLAGGMMTVLAACGGGGEEPAAGSDQDAGGSGFPVTVQHAFGETTIEEQPVRVVTAGFNEQDFALAAGVVPVGVREFLGYDAPSRPWAVDLLPADDIPTVGATELDLEAVAALEPDLILAMNAYIDDDTYKLLAQIAPTVAQPVGYAEGDTPWREQAELTGVALGRSDEIMAAVADAEAAFEAVGERFPELAGASASFALGGAYSLGANDYRTQWLQELDLTVPPSGGEVSQEQLDVFDTDVVLLEGADKLLDAPLFESLDAVREGRVVDLGDFDDDFAAALGFNSPLSLPYVLEVAGPRLGDAVDGDPDTRVEPYPPA